MRPGEGEQAGAGGFRSQRLCGQHGAIFDRGERPSEWTVCVSFGRSHSRTARAAGNNVGGSHPPPGRPRNRQERKWLPPSNRGADVAREARPEEAARTPGAPVKTRTEPVEITRSLSEEALKGYDFLFVGLDPAGMPEGGFNPDILASARSFGGPLAAAIARGAHKRDPISGPLRLLAPITGAPTSRRGAEVAIELARASCAELAILFLAPAASARSSIAERRRRALTGRNEEAAIKEVVSSPIISINRRVSKAGGRTTGPPPFSKKPTQRMRH